MVATWNTAASAAYYIQTAYYLGGPEPAGGWYAPAGDFGILDASTVDKETFERLFAAQHESGFSLLSNSSRRTDRVAAFDFTFSPGRSISLRWATANAEGRQAFELAHHRAVRKTLELVEREAGWARRGRGGSRIERVAITAAIFQHGESRPAEHADGKFFSDPNLHCHAVVMNLATRDDGSVGALHSTVLRQWKLAAGATYHAALAYELEKLGFDIDRVGKNGTFEIAGVSDEQIRYFSARRAEIESELAKASLGSEDVAARAASIARRTRKAKDSAVEDRHARWRKIAKEHGLIPIPIPALQAGYAPPSSRQTGEQLFAARLAQLPRSLTETSSLFDRRELFRAVAAALVGTGLDSDHIDTGVEHLLSNGLVTEWGSDALGQPRYSTPEMIAIEREIVQMARRLLNETENAVDPALMRDRCSSLNLSKEQTAAAVAATSKNRVVVVAGAPGTGKTTVLTPIVEALQEADYHVLGAASAWRIAHNLRDDLGIPARATASWLKRIAMGQPVLDDRSVLIVDEAGLLSSREMHAILTAVEKASARLILVGDRAQLQAIGAGAGLSLVTRAAASSPVTQIVRQRELWLRDAIAAIGRGEPLEALSAFQDRDCIIEAEGFRAALKTVVDCVEPELFGDSTPLILAKTNAEVAAISEEVRSRLKKAGIVSGAEIAIHAATPSGHSTQIALACGDRIRFLVRDDQLGVVNGSTGTVRHVVSLDTNGTKSTIIEADVNGRTVQFDTRELADEKGRARIGWAYASTVYGAQGLTVEKAVVLLTASFDRHHIYVAASRSRGATTLVVDRHALDELVLERNQEQSPLQITQAERFAALASKLAITNFKETTLDAADIMRMSQSDERKPEAFNAKSAPDKRRQWESDHEL